MAAFRLKSSLTPTVCNVSPAIVKIQRRTVRTRSRVVGAAQDTDDDADTNTYSAQQPWQTLVGIPARASWRASSSQPPVTLVDAQINILERGQRTSKQLKRTFQRVLKQHIALAGRREQERVRVKNRFSRPDSLKHKAEMAQAASINPVYYRQEQTLSSLRHRLLPNYAILKRVLMEAQSLIGPERYQPERVIDFGIGCGSASAAALHVFDSIQWVHGIDPSRSMRDCAEQILKDVSQDRSTPARITLNSSLSTDTRGSESAGFDLAIFAYTATELPHTASTFAAAAALWEKLKPNGVFVMVEPGTPDGFSSIRSVRSMLLDCCPPDDSEQVGQDECHIIAPCTHNKTCPMERHKMKVKGDRESEEYIEEDLDEDDEFYEEDSDDDPEDDNEEMEDDSPKSTMAETVAFRSSFCSFVHTMPGANHRSKGEKLSYLVAQKRIAGDAETDDSALDERFNEFHGTNIRDLLAQLSFLQNDDGSYNKDIVKDLEQKVTETQTRYLESEDEVGLEFLRGDTKRHSFGRMIRAPIKKRGHVIIDYCAAPKDRDDGRIVRHRVGRAWCGKVAPGMYSAARKARWGGLWPDLLQEEIVESDDTEESDSRTA